MDVRFPDAAATCAALTVDGLADWRVPNRWELVSLLDYGAGGLSSDVFGDTELDYWSSWTAGAFGASGGIVEGGGNVSRPAGAGFAALRCVRGDSPAGGYRVQNGGATVFDPKTGLEWQRAVPPPMFWNAALAYCNELDLAGGCWRLPNVKELLTIVENTARVPPVDADAFPDTPAAQFWTSTLTRGTPGDVDTWMVLFENELAWTIPYQAGTAVSTVGDSPFHVRCVR
jgi:hypothetical protein